MEKILATTLSNWYLRNKQRYLVRAVGWAERM